MTTTAKRTRVQYLADLRAKKIASGLAVHGCFDFGHEFGSRLAETLQRQFGFVWRKSLSTCKVASGEWHLQPGEKTPAPAKRIGWVEITSACFMGPFTSVHTHEES